MKRLVLLTSFTLIYLVSQAQVIDYVIDPTFNSSEIYTHGGVSSFVLTNNGNIFVSGSFEEVFTPNRGYTLITYDGELLVDNYLANSGSHSLTKYKSKIMTAGGSLYYVDENEIHRDQSFNFEYKKQAYSGSLLSRSYDALVTPENNIIVAGRFYTDSTLVSTPLEHFALSHLCMVDSIGSPVLGFPMLRCTNPNIAWIMTIDTLSTGEYIIAGYFTEIEGHSYTKIAKLNTDFSVNTEFGHPFSNGLGSLRVAYIDSEDRIWVLREGNEVLGYPNYPSTLVRLLPDGTVDESYQPLVFTSYFIDDMNNPTSPFDIYPYTIIEDSDSTFIMGGSFIEVNGEFHNRLIKIHENGEIIEGAFGGIGPDEAVWGDWEGSSGILHILKLPDGKLLIGGQFSSFGGVPYNCMVRLKPSGYVGIDETSAHKALKIYPNPAKDFIRIDLPGANAYRQEVRIFDLSGRLVLSASAVESQGKIVIENLSSGLYVVRVLRDSGVFTGKFLVD